jgi:hypothetical protein
METQTMIEFVISGGQTGADQAGLWAAHDCRIETGGSIVADCMTEDGPNPFVAGFFELTILETDDYRVRTRKNIEDSDGTILFRCKDSSGSKLTISICNKLNKPKYIVIPGITTPREVACWLIQKRIKVVNVAGNRASQAPPDFFDKVYGFMVKVLRITNVA